MTQITISETVFDLDQSDTQRIQVLKVGTPVKILMKESSRHTVHPDVVVGFDPFASLPTITLAYIDFGWQDMKIKFVSFNKDTENIEIVAAREIDSMEVQKEKALKILDADIERAEAKVEELKRTREVFLDRFQMYWTPGATE